MASVGEFLLGKPDLCMSKHGSDRGQVDCLVSSFVPVHCSTMRIPKTVFSLCGPRLGSTETFLLERHSAERNRRALFPSLSLRFANIPDTRVGRSSDLLGSLAHERTAIFSLEHTILRTVSNRACSMAVLDILLAPPSGSDHRRGAAMDLRLPSASRSRELLSWRRVQRAVQFLRSNMKQRPPLSQ